MYSCKNFELADPKGEKRLTKAQNVKIILKLKGIKMPVIYRVWEGPGNKFLAVVRA